MNEALQTEFCMQENCEDLILYNNRVCCIEYEATEVYYGQALIQPVIKKSYSIEEVERWINLEEQKEAELANLDNIICG